MKCNFSFFLVLILVFISACTKIKTTEIGSGLIPPIDGINTRDTILDVEVKNASDTFIRVPLGEDHVVGYIDDPLFGKTSASISVELKPTTYPYRFDVSKDSLHFDSIVLVLSYKGVWGDTSEDLALRVNQIDKMMAVDTVYPSTHTIAATTSLLENGLKYVDSRKLDDSLYPYNEAATHQIRLRLNASLGQKLLKQFDTTNAYKNDSLFRENFHGFQISAEPGIGNALLRVNLLDSNTKLAIYYKYKIDGPDGAIDTAAVRYFRTNQYTTAHSNYIHRSYAGSQIASYYPSNHEKDDLIFLQTGGVYASLKIPQLSGFPNVLIHRAELIADQEPDEKEDKFFSPPSLFLSGYSDTSKRRFSLFPDVQFGNGGITNLAEFGIYPFKQEDPITKKAFFTYHFNISRFVQGIATKQNKNSEMVLFAPYYEYVNAVETVTMYQQISDSPLNYPATGRVRLVGSRALSPHKMRVHIIYSLVK